MFSPAQASVSLWPFATYSDAGDVQLAVQILAAQERWHAKRERASGQRSSFIKSRRLAREGAMDCEEFDIGSFFD
jgi:hypothetical protein